MRWLPIVTVYTIIVLAGGGLLCYRAGQFQPVVRPVQVKVTIK